MLNLEINVAAILHNIKIIRKYVKSELNAVIKANCYGHGIELAKYIEPYVDSFSVSSVSEAKEAKNTGIEKKIYILGTINPEDFEPLDNVVYTVCSKEDIDILTDIEYNFDVAVKVNTGMNRLGVSVGQLSGLIDFISASDKLRLDSVYTHFHNVEEGSHKEQFSLFNSVISGLRVKKHCCASNCLKVGDKYHKDMIRCGLALYGYGHKELIPALKAYSTVAQINYVNSGECVGYGNYVLEHDGKIAIIRAGYADGYRRIHNIQYASAEGKQARIIGQVSMDMTAVDVTGTIIKKNDRVYLIDGMVTAESLAVAADTIVYEILTAFNGCRVRRTYINAPSQAGLS